MSTFMEISSSIENTTCELENALGLLVCLLEFCEDEGYSPPEDTRERKLQRADTFFDRMQFHAPLLRCAISILRSEQEHLTTIVDVATTAARQEVH